MMKKKYKDILNKTIIYYILILVGFVFLYPIIYMLSYSLMDIDDLVNPLVKWIPTKLYLGNYEVAIKVLDYIPSLLKTIFVVLVPSVIQTISASLVGYGLSRFQFKGSKIILFLVIATFVIPPQVTMIPQFLMYKDLVPVLSVF